MVIAALVLLDVVADDAAVQAAGVKEVRVNHVNQQPRDGLAVLLKLLTRITRLGLQKKFKANRPAQRTAYSS
jgi:hypothetical protein